MTEAVQGQSYMEACQLAQTLPSPLLRLSEDRMTRVPCAVSLRLPTFHSTQSKPLEWTGAS